MFETLKSFFRPPQQTATIDDDARPLAIAALLVEAARADENYTDIEKGMITAALSSIFGLQDAEALALRKKGEEAQQNADDLHRFTKTAKTLPVGDKRDFLEEMWRIALSDGTRDAYEDALIRRLCGLMHISDIESAKARQRVAAET